jgi:NADH-quinone oxidoreductase subunit N
MNPSQYDVARQTFVVLLPEMILLLAATAMMTAGALVRVPRRNWCASSAVALGVALIALLDLSHISTDIYASVALNDAFSVFGRAIFLLTGLIVLALAHDQVDDARAAEFFGSLLLMNAGAMLVAAANELVFLFVGLELVSMPTYLLLYLSRRTKETQEAATKYFFLSIFFSSLTLFGLAYLYGIAGVSNLKALAFLADHVTSVPQPQFALIAIVFVIAGLGFRVAAVPFHFYAPDVYQGSPVVIAAVLSWVPKAVGFMAMLRTITAIVSAGGATAALSHRAVLLAWLIAVVSMTLGNTVALAQENLKRLLAYSSISHAGFLTIGVAVAFRSTAESVGVYFGAESVLFYLTAYALMTLGAFGVIVLLSTPERPVEAVSDLAGVGRTHPGAAVAMAICLFSLAGIPPLAGFWAKFEVFASALSVGPADDSRLFYWLAVIGVVTAAIGAYYYLRIVMVMYLRQPTGETLHPRYAWPAVLAVTACASLTVLLGVFPAPVQYATREAAQSAIALPDPTGQPGPIAGAAQAMP